MQNIKFIQINIYKGKYLEALVEFLQRENPDIITMQEVSVAEANLCSDKSANLFELIRGEMGLGGVYTTDVKLEGFPNSAFGNAVLSRFPITGHKMIKLKEFRPLTLEEFSSTESIWPFIPRHLLDATIDLDGQSLHAISWHGAWTAPPQDTPETERQAKIVVDHLSSISVPFIIGGDLNTIPQSKTIQMVSSIATNLMEGSGILQTMNSRLHRIGSRGYLVDYIFTSKHFKKISLDVPQVDVSDHLPVVAELEFEPTPDRHSEPRPSLRAGEES